jgi:hypothetical protein
MTPHNLKPIGITCFVVCAICLFVAFERYQTNAANVKAMQRITQSTPFGGASPLGDLQPATPAVTKYALFFAFIAGAGGVFCFARSGPPKPGSGPVA